MEQPRGHYDFFQGHQEYSTYVDPTSVATPLNTTPIAANGVYDGYVYDCGNAWQPLPGLAAAGISGTNVGHATPGYFRVFAASDVAGTLVVQQSPDGTNWFQTSTQAVSAGVNAGVSEEYMVVMRFVRVVYTNGATLQTHFELDTALVSR